MRQLCPHCGRRVRPLSASEIAVANRLVRNLEYSNEEIGQMVGLKERTVKQCLKRIYALFGIDETKERRVVLAYWWTCELFQQGLRELGMIAEQKVSV